MKARIALLATAGGLLLTPAAAAHVTANPSEAAAGGFAMIEFRVPHGCEESSTTSLTVQIPDGVASVTPEAVAGWEVETVSGELAEPIELHGETITEGVKEVTWTGGPLDAHQFTDFGISMALPDTPGETLWFPAVQTCEQGETRWIQIPVDGEPEPDEPAPGLTLLAAADGHGGEEEPAAEDGAADAMSEETAEAAPVVDSDDGDDGWLDWLAVGLGGGGLAAGLAALGLTTRRRPRTS